MMEQHRLKSKRNRVCPQNACINNQVHSHEFKIQQSVIKHKRLD